jgi:hypothetical protein
MELGAWGRGQPVFLRDLSGSAVKGFAVDLAAKIPNVYIAKPLEMLS